MEKQGDEEFKRALAPLLHTKEHVTSIGTVLPGLGQFWAIIVTVLAILCIALIPDAKARSVAILVLLPVSIVMQLISMIMKARGALQPGLFALTTQRLILFKIRKGTALPIRSIQLNDVQSVDVSPSSKTNTVHIIALDREAARTRKLRLQGDTELPIVFRHAIEDKSSR